MYQLQIHHHIHFLQGKKTKPELSKNVWRRTGGQPGGLVQSLHNRWKGRHLRGRKYRSHDKVSLGSTAPIPVSPSAPLWTMHPPSFWQASSPPPSPPAFWSWSIRSCIFPSPQASNNRNTTNNDSTCSSSRWLSSILLLRVTRPFLAIPVLALDLPPTWH